MKNNYDLIIFLHNKKNQNLTYFNLIKMYCLFE